MIDELSKIRYRAYNSQSLTGKQAKLLVDDRDYYLKLLLGSQNALMALRAFMADDAPEWAKKNVKAAMDTNEGIMLEYDKFVKEHHDSRN